jgi:hypothetical protein
MRKKMMVSTLVLLVMILGFAAIAEAGRPREQVWADGELFGTVVTPAQFNAGQGNFDELYLCPGGFKDGLSLISESKPGDQDYNGGRWHLNVIAEGMDCNPNADSVEDLNLANFVATDQYFECPLLPMRGGGQS